MANYNTANFSIRSDAERICCSQWPSSRPPSVAAAAAQDGTRLIRADQGHLQYGGALTILPKKFLATHITRELDPPAGRADALAFIAKYRASSCSSSSSSLIVKCRSVPFVSNAVHTTISHAQTGFRARRIRDRLCSGLLCAASLSPANHGRNSARCCPSRVGPSLV